MLSIAGEDEGEVSALALMNEKSPEAWLGNFLTIINAPPNFSYTSIDLARRDQHLRDYLSGVADEAAREDPERLLERGFAEELRVSDWGAWWRAEDALTRYAYSTLSLAMLGESGRMATAASLYKQEANPRIQKDAHVVLCYLLGKEWPGYSPTESDLIRTSSGNVSLTSGA